MHSLIEQGTTETEHILTVLRATLGSIGVQNASAGEAHGLHASFHSQV